MVPVRDDVSVFAVKLHVRELELAAVKPPVMVLELASALVRDSALDVQLSQLPPVATAASHEPPLDTLNVVAPAAAVTLWVDGVTDSTGVESDTEKIVP